MGLFSAKKDEAQPDLVPLSNGEENSGEVEQLASQLERLRDLSQQAKERLVAILARREAPAAPAVSASADTAAIAALQQKIEGMSEKLERLAGSVAARPTAAATETPSGVTETTLRSLAQQVQALLQPVQRSLDGTERHFGSLATSLLQIQNQTAQYQARVEEGLRQMAELLTAKPPEPEPAAPAISSSDWEKSILGPDLVANSTLDFQRQRLIQGVLDGDPGARGFAGQLLVFQSSPTERLPQMLKEIGEAYYRWHPKISAGTNPMEEALVAWLQRTCETMGIHNAIELVFPGERFDSARHVTNTRGVEITEVLGWIVLRDNGKVYTKASVVVR